MSAANVLKVDCGSELDLIRKVKYWSLLKEHLPIYVSLSVFCYCNDSFEYLRWKFSIDHSLVEIDL